jgi:predicted CoA-substrate-specific enzyme activase
LVFIGSICSIVQEIKMITAGIDLGIETVKAVILKDGRVIARSIALSGGANRSQSAELVWSQALAAAGIKASDVNQVVATGQGKNDVKFAAKKTVEPVADARAARFLYPSARSVVDAGADQVRVVTLDAGDKILEVVMNQKCAAGLGLLLRSMARTLGTTVEEMGLVTGDPPEKAASDICPVFAELDAIAMIHNNVPQQDIIRALDEAVAVKINSIMNDKIRPEPNTTVLIGGLARNQGLVKALSRRSGINFLIPEHPEYGCALGAAVMAMSKEVN